MMRDKRIWRLAAGVGLMLGAAAPMAAQQSRAPLAVEPPPPLTASERTMIDVTRRVSPAVVGIRVQGGAGSGVIIRRDGVILTNAHVVENSRSVIVQLANGTEVQGQVLGQDPTVDIAVVRIPGSDLPVAPLSDSDRLEVGQAAIAIGNPFGLERTVTTGIISALQRNIGPRGPGADELIQTDAAINPGNSGGPLLNSAGQVVGINTAAIPAAVGLGFAVPINLARDVAEQLLTTGVVRRAQIGIEQRAVDPEFARQFDLPARQGVLVLGVLQGSPAAQAGLRRGDIITRIDDTPINGEGDLRRFLRETSPGTSVTVSGMRTSGNGGSFTTRLRLGEVTISGQQRR